MSRTITEKIFLERAKALYGDTYDYSKIIYINYKSKIEIVCPKHGSFWQTPVSHVGDKHGCHTCGMGKFRTKEIFIQDAREIHGDVYDYSEVNFTKVSDKVIINCLIHGKFTRTVHGHLTLKQGCGICGDKKQADGMRKSTETFVNEANLLHKNAYDYSETVYTGVFNTLEIRCCNHGIFTVTPKNHLRGTGCPKCKKSKSIRHSFKFFNENENEKHKKGMFYVLELSYRGEYFYKIGITTSDIKTRFRKGMDLIDIKPIIEYKTTIFDAFVKEQAFLKLLKPYKYYPKTNFKGYTECFKYNKEIINTIERYLGINI